MQCCTCASGGVAILPGVNGLFWETQCCFYPYTTRPRNHRTARVLHFNNSADILATTSDALACFGAIMGSCHTTAEVLCVLSHISSHYHISVSVVRRLRSWRMVLAVLMRNESLEKEENSEPTGKSRQPKRTRSSAQNARWRRTRESPGPVSCCSEL